MQVTFVMFKADGTRRDFPLTKERIVIGRKNTCDLRIPLSSVSRQHCEVRIAGNTAKIKDLGSSNGTYHNTIRVQETTLAAGDEVVIGPVVFTVVIDGKPERVEPGRSDLAVAAAAAGSEMDESPAMAGVHADDDDEDESPQTLLSHTDDDDDDDLVPGHSSVTVDLDDDDDPIAALERLAEAERNGGGGGASADSEFDFLIGDDDDDDKKKR